jgi:small subunit ribosomal protein S3
MAVGETSGHAKPRRVITAGGGRRRPGEEELGTAGTATPEGDPSIAAAFTDEAAVAQPGEVTTDAIVDDAAVAAPVVREADPETERLLAEEEEIERRTRQHHETPHFRTGDE